MTGDIPRRALGRTGELVSAIGLGGWHLALKNVDASLAHRIVGGAIDRGITFMDNSWDYNDGERASAGWDARSRTVIGIACFS